VVIRVGDRYAPANCDIGGDCENGYGASANRELTPVRMRARAIDYRVIEWARACMCVTCVCVYMRVCITSVCASVRVRAACTETGSWPPHYGCYQPDGGASAQAAVVARLLAAGIRSISFRHNTHTTGLSAAPAFEGRARRADGVRQHGRPSAAAAAHTFPLQLLASGRPSPPISLFIRHPVGRRFSLSSWYYYYYARLPRHRSCAIRVSRLSMMYTKP